MAAGQGALFPGDLSRRYSPPLPPKTIRDTMTTESGSLLFWLIVVGLGILCLFAIAGLVWALRRTGAARRRAQASEALEFHLIKRPQIEARIRLPEDQLLGSLSTIELVQKYWKSSHTDPEEVSALNTLAEDVIRSVDQPADSKS